MTGRDFPACTFALLAAGTLSAHAGAAEPAAAGGRIEGEIEPAGSVARISAVDRDVKQKPVAREVAVREIEGRILPGGSGYVIALAPGTYDLHVELRGEPGLGERPSEGRIIEGADLRADASEGARGPAQALRDRDRERIVWIVKNMRTWSNEKRVLAIEGAAERAKALVKLVRTEPTSYDGQYGEPVAVVRWEVWNFRKYTGSWRREPKARVLRRFLFPKRRLGEVPWEFDPALGGVDVKAGGVVRRDLDFSPRAVERTPAESPRPPPRTGWFTR